MNIEYKYPNAVIYDIFYQSRRLYTGSSINFPKRKRDHKYGYNNKTTTLYKKMKEENIDFKDLQFIIYKEYPCNNIKNLRIEEGICIKNLKPEFNIKIDGRTVKEYTEDNKEKRKKYYEKKKENRKDYQKIYYEKNKEKYQNYNQIYYKENKEKLKNYKKNEYEKKKEKIICECGIEYCKINKIRHEKSKRHIELLKK